MTGWLTTHLQFAEHRWDYGYHAFQQMDFFTQWERIYPSLKLGDIIQDDSYGILTPGDVYSPEHPITFLRATDMRSHMEVDSSEALKVPEEYFRHTRARLRKNDIMLAIKGASIASGKSVCFVGFEPKDTIVNGTVFHFQVKDPHNPFFVATMLDSEIVKGQVRNLQIPNNAVAYVDKPSIHALRIPLPPRDVQDHIAGMMQAAYAARREKLAEVERLVKRVEVLVLGGLSIDVASLHRPRAATKRISEIAGGRFDYEAVTADTSHNINGILTKRLGEVVAQVTDRILPPEECPSDVVNYISLAHIGSNTGELVDFAPVKGSEVLSSSVKFQQGDILFGRMRPYLNKVWIAEFDGICTGEAVVIRPNTEMVDTAFLHALLMSQITLIQVVPFQSGTSLPRVSASHVLGIKLPIPNSIGQQGEISAEIIRRRTEAKRLRAEAEQVVAEAKARVERMLLGEEGA
jgi:restriction endonuclease S subunit